VWWYTAVIPALKRLRQKDDKIETSLGYIAGPCLKNNNDNKNKQKPPNKSQTKKTLDQPGVVTHTYNPSTQEEEARGY
jgi:hypothetical protein